MCSKFLADTVKRFLQADMRSLAGLGGSSDLELLVAVLVQC